MRKVHPFNLVAGSWLLLMLLTTCAPPPQPAAVFPGAVGFGRETSAGRHGHILRVTNLSDSGKGSLRDALAATEPRTIVFDVGGTISLKSNLVITSPQVTVAGQTAPSPGVTLKGAGLIIRTHDVLVQHLRVRVGDEPGGPEAESRDAVTINGPASNVVVDHISASWAIDENISIWDGASNITISNCIISESLHQSRHPKGPHGNGMLIGSNVDKVTLIGNLFAHNDDRNPRITNSTSVLMMNNVMYNNRHQTLVGSPAGPALLTAIGNVYIDGPVSKERQYQIEVYPPESDHGTKVYLSGNKVVSRRNNLIWGYATSFDPAAASPPIWCEGLVPLSADAAEGEVAARAGAWPADRDDVDRRIIADLRSRTGRIINTQAEVGGWADSRPVTRPFALPVDPHDDDDRDGYTNLEELLHGMSAQVEGVPVRSPP